MKNLEEFLAEGNEWFKRYILTIREYANKIQESEEWLSTTLNSIGDAVIATDKSGNIRFMNPVAEALTGWKQEEATGKPLEDIFNIINEETHKKVESPVSRVLREGVIVGLANHTILLAKDGKEIPIDDSGAPIKDDKGNVVGVVLIFRDITERKEAEIMIREERDKAKKYIDLAGVLFVAIDAKEEITLINKKGCEILGFKQEEIIGKNYFDTFIPERSRNDVRNVFQKIINGEIEPVEFFENSILTKNGDERIIAWHNTSIKNKKGEIVASLSSGEDITERNKAEQKLRESESLYRMAYDRANFYKDLFAHDMNNILQAILSGLQLNEIICDDLNKREDLKTNLRIMKNQIIRGSNLISNVRKLSQLEEIELSQKKIEICNILKNLISTLKNTYQTKNLNIQVHSIGKNLHVQADDFLVDVFENILINSVRHNRNSSVEITVRISREQKNSVNYLKVEFQDNGKGIANTRKEKIFQRGYTDEKSVQGMGLGLSLVKKIVKNYNGEIWVEDRIKGDHSKGSNFILLIPELN